MIGNIVSIITGYLSSYTQSPGQYGLIRLIVALGVGIIIAVAPVQLNEMGYKGWHQRNMVIVNLSFAVGGIIATLLAYFCFETSTKGDWRLFIKISNVVSLVAILLTYKQ